ncbi:MAG: CPBP family intramembrane glutamic endopeptidase [Ferruginibacter sp.]|nr:CPBP family intramembrane metalloprotease [Ferruginibacter sp.]
MNFERMKYKSKKGFTGWGQLGFLFAFLGFGVVLAGAVQYLIALQILPAGKSITDADAIMSAMLAPQNVGMARLSQVLGTLALLFIPALLWNFVSNGKSFLWLGFSKYINGYQILLGFAIIFTASLVASPLADFSKYIVAHFPTLDTIAKKMEATYTEQATALSNLKSMQEYIVALFIMAFFPAMFEEVFFRGTLQNLLVKWLQNPFVAIFITSVIFSLIHASIYLFLSRLALGLALGLMFYYTKNIWVNIIAHFINNAIALTQLYSMRNSSEKLNLDKLEPHLHWSIAILATAALVGLFILLKKHSAYNKAKIEAKENLAIANSNIYGAIVQNEN